jgi:parallel beta-helix repeat protein
MLLSEVTDSIITRNTITNNGEGILLAGSSNNQITRNLLANNTYAVHMINSASNNVSANRISFNVDFGIHMDDCSNNTVANNYMSHGKQGLIMNRGDNNTVTGNSIFYTREKGAHIGASTNNLVTGNTIAWSNGWGLTVSGDVGNNCIYHNNFVNNVVNNVGGGANQAYPGVKMSNTWDNGKEGNFWSNYQNNYPTAKQVEGSNVWDTAVTLNENNIDHFPLVNPLPMEYEVTLLQPTHAPVNASGVPLVFFATGPVSWLGYSVDGGANVTVNGEVNTANLPVDVYSVTVYAGVQGGVCGSATVQFQTMNNVTSTATPTPTASPVPTATTSATPETNPPQDQTPSTSSTPTTQNLLSLANLQWPILGAITVAAVIGLVAVWAKRKH